MQNFNFEEWLEKHNTLVAEAQELFLKRGFKAIIVEEEKKPSYVRIFLGKKSVDFYVKEIMTRMAQVVWLCKKSDVSSDKHFLVRTKREGFWMMISGKDAEREGEYRDSEWQTDVKYLVVPTEMFKPAKTFIKLMKTRLDSQMQKRINDF